MPGDKHLFAPKPLRAMKANLSGLQHSVLDCVSAHDRMSLVTGKGQGCRASNQRMCELVGCSFARLCSTLSELVELGLLQREKLGRHTVYRVIYNDEDRLLFGNVSDRNRLTDRLPNGGVTCCQHTSDNGQNPPETASQYIPLNGGRYSVETGEDNSSEEARFAARGSPERVSFDTNIGGQLARLERLLKSGAKLDCLAWYAWLELIEDVEHRYWALRLSEQLVNSMDDENTARGARSTAGLMKTGSGTLPIRGRLPNEGLPKELQGHVDARWRPTSHSPVRSSDSPRPLQLLLFSTRSNADAVSSRAEWESRWPTGGSDAGRPLVD